MTRSYYFIPFSIDNCNFLETRDPFNIFLDNLSQILIHRYTCPGILGSFLLSYIIPWASFPAIQKKGNTSPLVLFTHLVLNHHPCMISSTSSSPASSKSYNWTERTISPTIFNTMFIMSFCKY